MTSVAAPSEALTPRKGRFSGFALLHHPPAVIAAVVVVGLLVGTVGAPIVAPYGANQFDYTNLFSGPSLAHPFGTDELGRDLLTRVLYGGRTSLAIAALTTVLAMTLGSLWGFGAAFRGGWVDDVLMRIADLTLGLPTILLGLVFVAAFGTSTVSLVIILGIVLAPATARIARSALLSELEADYYLAALSVGAAPWRIVLRELLPNAAPVLLARASLVAADAIFVVANLSFVGLGEQPPATSWGTLLHQGYVSLYRSYWYPIFPGLVILISVLALNTLGDNLQRVLDPSRR